MFSNSHFQCAPYRLNEERERAWIMDVRRWRPRIRSYGIKQSRRRCVPGTRRWYYIRVTYYYVAHMRAVVAAVGRGTGVNKITRRRDVRGRINRRRTRNGETTKRTTTITSSPRVPDAVLRRVLFPRSRLSRRQRPAPPKTGEHGPL